MGLKESLSKSRFFESIYWTGYGHGHGDVLAPFPKKTVRQVRRIWYVAFK